MKYYPYPLAEFCDHFRAMKYVRDYETVRLNHSRECEPIKVAQSRDPEAQLLQMLDYMAQVIDEQGERTYKAVRLHSSLIYLARNIGTFADAGLVRCCSDAGPDEVSLHLVQALHCLFAVDEPG